MAFQPPAHHSSATLAAFCECFQKQRRPLNNSWWYVQSHILWQINIFSSNVFVFFRYISCHRAIDWYRNT